MTLLLKTSACYCNRNERDSLEKVLQSRVKLATLRGGKAENILNANAFF